MNNAPQAKKLKIENVPLIIQISRDVKGMSQEELAAAANVCQSNISKIEANAKGIVIEDFCAIMEALGYDVMIKRKKC